MKQAINTRTQEEYDALMRWCEENKYIWANGKLPEENKIWQDERHNTCIEFSDNEMTYCGYDDAICWKWQIIPFSIYAAKNNIPYTEFAKANIVGEKSEFQQLYPDKTDAQIIELLSWELGEKVQEIGRLLIELNGHKSAFEEAVELLEEQLYHHSLNPDSPFTDKLKQFLTNHKDGE